MKKDSCYISGCRSRVFINGLCKFHYTLAFKNKLNTEDKESVQARMKYEIKNNVSTFFEVCSVDGCMRLVFVKGLCKHHYRQSNDEGPKPDVEVKPKVPRKFYREAACYIKGCNGKAFAKGLCSFHYRQARYRRLNLDSKEDVEKNLCEQAVSE